ncbi:MAG: methylmalonyl-CoA epimerase [Caldithrix sp. RBG_13_44_9]|nr:MAG: methylmalonyl-CoA epimerase [Caldithrix sp. RBG_13_44_9]
MLRKIDHIGIAVHSVEEVKSFFLKIFDLKPVFEESVQDQQVKVVGFKLGESNIEFLEPTSPESPVAKFLEKRGQGMHHLSVEVQDIEQTIATLKSQRIQLIDEKAKIGAEGKKIAFLHPKSTFGILLELSQKI